MDNKFTEEFPLDRFVNTVDNFEEFLYKFENERKLSDLPKQKTSYTLKEFLDEFPNAKDITAEVKEDVSGNVSSSR